MCFPESDALLQTCSTSRSQLADTRVCYAYLHAIGSHASVNRLKIRLRAGEGRTRAQNEAQRRTRKERARQRSAFAPACTPGPCGRWRRLCAPRRDCGCACNGSEADPAQDSAQAHLRQDHGRESRGDRHSNFASSNGAGHSKVSFAQCSQCAGGHSSVIPDLWRVTPLEQQGGLTAAQRSYPSPYVSALQRLCVCVRGPVLAAPVQGGRKLPHRQGPVARRRVSQHPGDHPRREGTRRAGASQALYPGQRSPA